MGRIHYVIDEQLHRRAKAAAAHSSVTLRALIVAALEREVRRVERRMGVTEASLRRDARTDERWTEWLHSIEQQARFDALARPHLPRFIETLKERSTSQRKLATQIAAADPDLADVAPNTLSFWLSGLLKDPPEDAAYWVRYHQKKNPDRVPADYSTPRPRNRSF